MRVRLRDGHKDEGGGGHEVGGMGVGGRRGGDGRSRLRDKREGREGGSVGGLMRCVCAGWWGECLYDGGGASHPVVLKGCCPFPWFPLSHSKPIPLCLVWFRPR